MHRWWECRLGQPLCRKHRTQTYPRQSSNSTSRYLSKENKTRIPKGSRIPLFVAALSATSRAWKRPKDPRTDERIKKWCVGTCTHTHTHTMQCHPATTQDDIVPFATRAVELGRVLPGEASQREQTPRGACKTHRTPHARNRLAGMGHKPVVTRGVDEMGDPAATAGIRHERGKECGVATGTTRSGHRLVANVTCAPENSAVGYVNFTSN